MELCKQFLNGSNGGILILDRIGKIIFVNKTMLGILDQEEREVMGQNFFGILSQKPKAVFISNIIPLMPAGFLIYCEATPKTYNGSQALVVHQLRTPLTAIKWTIEDLLGANGLNSVSAKGFRKFIRLTNLALI